MKLSLRTLLLGLTSVAIIVVTVSGLVVNLRERIGAANLRMAAQTDLRTATGAKLLLDSLIVGDLAAVEQTLEKLNADHVWRKVRLYESDGRRLMLDASPTVPTPSGAPRWFSKLLPFQLAEHRLQIAADPVVYAVLAVTPASEGLERELWVETRSMGATTLVLLLTLLGLIHVILIYGLHPIRALGESAKRFGSGDLTARMPETSLHEVAPTVQAFNAMADSVEGLLAEVRAKEAANRRLAAVVEQSGEAILTIDLAHRITNWNVGAERLFARTAPEALGQSIGLVLVPEPGGSVAERIARLIETRPPGRLETAAVEPAGRELMIAAASSPLHNDDGSHAGYIVVARDITARKQAELELRRAKEAAEAGHRAKAEFLATMSHEIRTPMNGVIGMTELVLDTELTEEQREYLKLVQVSANALLQVINDILDFSKIEAGRLDMEARDFGLRTVLGQTLKALALRAHEKGLELVSAVDPDVPDGLIGDSGRLRQILVNLVGNALKFTERGEVVIRVAMGGAGAGEADLHFSVTDTGIGIATDKVERVFAAFTQADSSTTRRYGGTGLGLTISERLVGRMGGRIWVESEEGRGSAFHFTARFGLGTAPPRETPALDVTDLPGLSVLIVDDHPTSRRVIGEMLARRGLRPTIVASGGAALSALEDARARGGLPQLVVTDLQMPELDGFGLVELMKAEPELADIPVVMVSSSGLPAEAVLARELGIGAYLTKPVTEPELISAILTVLHLPAAAGTRPSRAAALPALAPAQRLRVLLAEDNVINQRVAVHVLERLGHRVVVAGTGRAALTALEEQAFDVVLMDVQMPEMDGIETTAAIRAREAEIRGSGARPAPSGSSFAPERPRKGPIPIIALTAHAMSGHREQCLAAGMDAFVSKPIQAEMLAAVLERIAGAKPAGSAESASPLFDVSRALKAAGGHGGLLAELAHLFAEDQPRQIARLGAAIHAGDGATARAVAHTIKGSAATLGATAVRDLAIRIETVGREGGLDAAGPLVEALGQEVARVIASFAEAGYLPTSGSETDSI